MTKHSKKLLKRIATVTNKRARLVLDRIVEHGLVTTEDLKRAGYDHPPRAARDVRELGFSLKTIRVKDSQGRNIAAYSLEEHAGAVSKSGRRELPKKLKAGIIAAAAGKCRLCGAETNLQVDHRIPYEVAGETLRNEEGTFQVLCGSCNRTKSWACEHCENWQSLKRIEICRACYWASPDNYQHVAMRPERRIDLVWIGQEVAGYDELQSRANQAGSTLNDYVKREFAKLAK